jgi:NAD+ kinase
VVAPSSVVALEVVSTSAPAVLCSDGRRLVDLPPGAQVEVRRGDDPIHLVRLHPQPFTDRLVEKFDLPVNGWRGGGR